MCERTAEEVSFEWSLHGFLYKDLKVGIGLFKKYHNTFCCHFLLQTFAEVLFSISSQEKLSTMLVQNFKGTTKSIVFFQKTHYVQNTSYFLKEVRNRYYFHGYSIGLKL